MAFVRGEFSGPDLTCFRPVPIRGIMNALAKLSFLAADADRGDPIPHFLVL